MKRFFLIGFFCFPLLLSAQHFELGFLLGASNYSGDLSNNSSSIYLQETHLAEGLFLRYNFNDYFTTRLGFNFAKLSGEDSNSKKDAIQQRNLSFETNLYEFSLIGEFNIMGYQPYNLSRPFSPYIFAGIALFRFNPRTSYLGEEVELQPLGTEGQGIDGFSDPYKLTSFAIPLGVGVKYALNDKWNLGFEIGIRKTFTDYIDDVSSVYVDPQVLSANGELAVALGNRQGELLNTDPIDVAPGTARGDDRANDTYFIAGFTISYNFLDNGLVGSRSGNRRGKKGCKTDF